MSLMSDLGTKIGTELKKKFDINTGSAQISFINDGNTTFFQTADQVGHPTVLIKKGDDARSYNSALMIAADADGGNLDNGSADIAIDIRGTASASTTIVDYTDITHRNAYITGGGTIWSKRYINSEMGLQEAGVPISEKYMNGTKHISTSAPTSTDGVDGDVWYQI